MTFRRDTWTASTFRQPTRYCSSCVWRIWWNFPGWNTTS